MLGRVHIEQPHELNHFGSVHFLLHTRTSSRYFVDQSPPASLFPPTLQATKRTRFTSFPPYLLVQMRRYYTDVNTWEPKKLDVRGRWQPRHGSTGLHCKAPKRGYYELCTSLPRGAPALHAQPPLFLRSCQRGPAIFLTMAGGGGGASGAGPGVAAGQRRAPGKSSYAVALAVGTEMPAAVAPQV